jgi:predicted dienelactone hydrolase
LNLRAAVTAGAGAALLAAASTGASAAGFQYGSAPDGNNPPLELAIWYPSDAPVSTQQFGLFQQDVAPFGPIAGQSLPLIVISHGTGGGASSHYDTALALADAGFVVVATSHTGDNYQDRAVSFTWRNFADRSRHMTKIVDFMLDAWGGHDRLDPARIGMFGHSAGGATALIVIGGNPEIERGAQYCQDHPDAWDCQRIKEKAQTSPAPAADVKETLVWTHDARVKAAAVAAPAIGYTFTPAALAAATAPVQLWRAEGDTITPNQWNADIVRDSLPKPPDDHLVPQAGHFDFLAPCNDAMTKVAPEICESAPGFDRHLFHQELNQALIAFFKAQLAPP